MEEAKAYLGESLRYDPGFAQAHYQLGVLLDKQQRSSEAIQELDQAAILDPSSPEPHYALARIYRKTGEREKADKALAQFLKLKNEKEKK
jgi:Flp pilus assembly protein TadD